MIGSEKSWVQCGNHISAALEFKSSPIGDSKKKIWFAPNVDFTNCFEAQIGPAGRIEESKGKNPSVVEKNGGRIVQVKADYDSGRSVIWMYYRDKSECERLETNVEKKLADKYR